MRGVEGSSVKRLYRSLAVANGVKGFRRDVASGDNVNVSLNVGNSILYGLALSVVSCLGLSPALGIIHQGSHRAFVLDVADMFKPVVSIPVAFRSFRAEDPVAFTRRKVREKISGKNIVYEMVNIVQEAFAPYLAQSDEFDTLIQGASEEDVIFGHINYGKE